MEEQITEQATHQTEKKSKAWIWILVILIILAIGVGVYFLLFGGTGIGGSSIPQPPALPE